MRPKKDTRNMTARPFRVFDSHTQTQIMGRWYIEEKRACEAACVICHNELKPGRTLEVLNIRSMVLRATYTKSPTGNIIIKDREKLREEERKKG